MMPKEDRSSGAANPCASITTASNQAWCYSVEVRPRNGSSQVVLANPEYLNLEILTYTFAANGRSSSITVADLKTIAIS
jgi:hypothetical protein